MSGGERLFHNGHLRLDVDVPLQDHDDNHGDGDSGCCDGDANGVGLVEERLLREGGDIGGSGVLRHDVSFRLGGSHYKTRFFCEAMLLNI